jgi:hypothetical protein
MRTTLTLDDDLLLKAQQVSGLTEPQLQAVPRRQSE